jgi:hypothetical protein
MPSQTRNLISTCREGGLSKSLISQLPGFLNLSDLISSQAESEVLIIIFFTSLEAAMNATGSPMGAFLFALLERMSKRSQNLGLFTFPDTTQLSEDDGCTQLTSTRPFNGRERCREQAKDSETDTSLSNSKGRSDSL